MIHCLRPYAFVLALVLIAFNCCSALKSSRNQLELAGGIRYVGVRSSIYGIRPFPATEGWKAAIAGTRDRVAQDAVPCAVWIVATRESARSCRLEFPAAAKKHENIVFAKDDRHESYLEFFDRNGIKVFLQVEPMHADVPTLIDLVLKRYGHHPSVIGFGVDVEWYREADRPEWGIPVDDATARKWEQRVKAHNPAYRLFLKHWDPVWMPPHHRGDIVFVDDSQMHESFEKMLDEFSRVWAARFAPNTVFFQVGYPSDRAWWSKLNDPPRDIALALARKISQPFGVFWVDFTLRDIFPGI